MPKPLPGPEYESLEFRRSLAYVEMQEALRAIGCRTYSEMLARPRHVRDRFHELWTEQMAARLESESAPPRPVPTRRIDEDRWEAVRRLNAEGFTDARIGDALGISQSRVQQIRAEIGLAPVKRGPSDADIAERVHKGMTDAAIARELRLSERYVAKLRLSQRLMRDRFPVVRERAAARDRRILALRQDGLSLNAIARIVGASKSTVHNAARLWHKQQEAA